MFKKLTTIMRSLKKPLFYNEVMQDDDAIPAMKNHCESIKKPVTPAKSRFKILNRSKESKYRKNMTDVALSSSLSSLYVMTIPSTPSSSAEHESPEYYSSDDYYSSGSSSHSGKLSFSSSSFNSSSESSFDSSSSCDVSVDCM